MEGKDLVPYIDHTLLRPNATAKDIIRLCHEAKKYGFVTVCVNGRWVSLAADILVQAKSKVSVCSVVGFPFGAMTSEVKAAEARKAISDGATEIDMVIDIGSMLEVDVGALIDFANLKGHVIDGYIANDALRAVQEDIELVVKVCGKIPVKVIIETVFLNKEQKEIACLVAQSAGAVFVNTCTGFSGGKVTAKDIYLMRQTVGPNMGVKASGGIKTKAQVIRIIKAGATRIGTSASVSIVTE